MNTAFQKLTTLVRLILRFKPSQIARVEIVDNEEIEAPPHKRRRSHIDELDDVLDSLSVNSVTDSDDFDWVSANGIAAAKPEL